MNRRRFLQTASLAPLAMSALPTRLRADDGERTPNRPNVLFIAADDLRDWVGFLGRNRQTLTPNLDRLAASGVSFANHHCPAPICNPSRAALMTGLRPSTSGVYNNDDDWRTVIPPEKTLITAFRRAGYYTCGAGKIYHLKMSRRSEWEDYAKKTAGNDPEPDDRPGVGKIRFGPMEEDDAALRDAHTVDYGIAQLGKEHGRPFFLSVGFSKPHIPWFVPKKYFDLHPIADIELPPHHDHDLDDVPPEGVAFARPESDHANFLKTGKWREGVQAYLATISYMDAQLGRLLDSFDRSAYRDNTVVVFWSDHGWHLGEKEHWRKFTLWEESTRVPVIWVAPGVTAPGGICYRAVDHMSIFPTLCDLCGIPIPAHVQGRSIRPLLINQGAEWDHAALTTYNRNNHAVRTAQWRYIRYAHGGEELYDKVNDVFEWHNLAGDPKYSAVKAELSRLFPTENVPEIPHKNLPDDDS